MFTCPENDIHSIYLDNELPENFKADYEAHLESCPKCKARLEALRKTHAAFQQDSKQLELSREFLDASFERLQSRMRYSKTTSAAADTKKVTMFPQIKKYIPVAAAAAAVFALVLPVGLRTAASPENIASVQTMKRASAFSLDQNRILTEVSDNVYPLQLATNTSYGEQNFTLDSFSPVLESNQSGNTYRRVAKPVSHASKLLADDFFSPSFTQNDGSTLQVYLP